jgi:hypothetical protein
MNLILCDDFVFCLFCVFCFEFQSNVSAKPLAIVCVLRIGRDLDTQIGCDW